MFSIRNSSIPSFARLIGYSFNRVDSLRHTTTSFVSVHIFHHNQHHHHHHHKQNRNYRRSLSTFNSENPENDYAFDSLLSDFDDETAFPLDEDYYRNGENQHKILRNIELRDMKNDYPQLFEDNNRKSKIETKNDLAAKLIALHRQLPNSFHPIWNTRQQNDPAGQMIIDEVVGDLPRFPEHSPPQKAETILHNLGLAQFADTRVGKMGIPGGRRSYVFYGELARLSRALSRWTLNRLIRDFRFTPVVVPTLIRPEIIRACGFEPFGTRTQVYAFDDPKRRSDRTQGPPSRRPERLQTCVAGTAEMPLAALHIGENFPATDCDDDNDNRHNISNDLPKRYCALSRCFRAEAKSAGEMSGLYRVHYFDKVEMFAITRSAPDPGAWSDEMLQEFVRIQRTLFAELGLHFRVVDMPPNELGKPAFRKFDMEAFMPGRNYWGEISSASNCTDYQAKRLRITYDDMKLDPVTQEIVSVRRKPVHTINGTACAVPRLIISIVEQNQTPDGKFRIPECLRPYMDLPGEEQKKEIEIFGANSSNKTL